MQSRMGTIQTNENVNLSNYVAQGRQRSGSPNQTIGSFVNGRFVKDKAGEQALQQVLGEKDNYIERLSEELNDLRHENEKLKDKLIIYELENLGNVRSVEAMNKPVKQGTGYRSN